MFQRDTCFPDRLQGHGFSSKLAASKDAKEKLGRKSRPNLAFVLLEEEGEWTWVNASKIEYATAMLAEHKARTH